MRNVTGIGPDTSGKDTGSGPLHLDHIGTLFGHQLGAIRSGHMLGEVQNLYIGKGLVRHEYPLGDLDWRKSLRGLLTMPGAETVD